ncbi:TPA: hypothetical protein J4786_003287 [Citrobacter amalonaticus]|nr:hypothetical protein [Citrobacter amalonaticus]HAZ4787841.1 hypothetical protein [Citrobacter amalonaticus]
MVIEFNQKTMGAIMAHCKTNGISTKRFITEVMNAEAEKIIKNLNLSNEEDNNAYNRTTR